MKSKKPKEPKPKPFMEPFEKKLYVIATALGALTALSYMYFFTQYYSFAETINDQSAQVAEFYKENTP